MNNKLGNVSFGLPGVLYHLGNILSRFYLRVYSVHCTYATSRNRRNLYSAFFRLLWDSPTCCFSLISLCNMHGYTSASLNAVSLAQGTGFVSDAVLRAGEGCFGLAIQMIVLFKFHAALPTMALDWGCMRELSGAVNVKCEVSVHKLVVPRIAKSNMPFIPFWFCSENQMKR